MGVGCRGGRDGRQGIRGGTLSDGVAHNIWVVVGHGQMGHTGLG